MSSLPPPDPITTGFNPEAWIADSVLLLTRTLQAFYMRFPTVQNIPTTFTSTLSCLTPSSSDNSTLVATTEWFNLFFTARKSFAGITGWSGAQQYNTILTPNITGNTRIGNAVGNNIEVATTASRTAVLSLGTGAGSSGIIEIGNGNGATNHVQILYSATNNSTGVVNLGNSTSTLKLRSPMTPLYAYPIATGKIGNVITGTLVTNITGTGAFGTLLRTVSLTAGSWFLYGMVTYTSAYSGYYAIGITTNTSGLNSIGRKGTFNNPTGMTGLTGIYLATSGFITVTGTTSMSIYLRTQSAITLNSSTLFAVRLS